MRPSKLTLENFGAYEGKHEIKLEQGLTFILGQNKDNVKNADSNAAGKTTILHAIAFALFGRTPNKLVASDLANESMVQGERMSVLLEFTKGYSIHRTWTRKGGSVTFRHPEQGLIAGDTAVVDQAICSALGITYPLFCNAMYLSRASTAVQFLTAKPAERAKVLGELVDDSVFQRGAVILKANRQVAESKYSRATHEIALRQANIDKNLDLIAKLNQDLESVQEREKVGRAEAKEKIAALQREMHELAAANLKVPKDKAQDLEDRRIRLRKMLDANTELCHNNQPLVFRVDCGERCPKCYSMVTPDTLAFLEKENKQRKATLEKARHEQVVITRDLQSIEARKKALQEWEVESVKNKLRLAELNNELAHQKTRLEEVTKGTMAILDRIKQLQAQVDEEAQQIYKLKDQNVETANEIHVTSKLITIFQSEIRNLLFDGIRGSLEYLTEQYVRTIAGEMLSVEYPSKDSSGREKFDILLHRGGKAKDLSSFSEGEAWRATFAILLALRETLLTKAGCKLSMLLVDDPVGVLDTVGTLRYAEVLRELADKGLAEVILVSLPKADMIASDRVITVVKEKGSSRCEYGFPT